MSNAVIGALRVNLGLDSAQFESGASRAKGQMTSLGDSAKRLGVALAGVFSAGALMRGAQSAVNAFASFQRQTMITEQVLKSTGFAAGRTAEQLEQLARSIGASTLASTQEVRDAANQLLTFRSIAGETFDRTLRAAQDLSTVGFGSLSSTTQQLAKALEDPIRGLNSLRRAGVSFSDEQRRVIASFVETGNVAAAQNEILKAVEAQVGGAGAAAGGGLAGAYDTLNEEIKLFIERTGQQIAELTQLESVIKAITGLMTSSREKADPINQLTERIANRQRDIDRLQSLIDSESSGRALRQQQLDAMLAAQATDRLSLANLRLRQGMQEYNAERRSEIEQEKIRRSGLAEGEEVTNRLAAATRSAGASMSEMALAAARVFDATRTPAERLGIEIAELNRLVQSGAIDWETYNRAVDQAQRKFDDASASGSNLASTLGGQFASMFEGVVSGTQSVSQAIGNLLKQLGSLLINKAFQMLLGGAAGGTAGAGASGIFSAIFGGYRAAGGPVSAGKAYMVGERGPEMIIPRANGTVIPNHDLQGAGAGGPIQIEVSVSPTGEFDARVANVADQRAQVMVRTYDRSLPNRLSSIQKRGG